VGFWQVCGLTMLKRTYALWHIILRSDTTEVYYRVELILSSLVSSPSLPPTSKCLSQPGPWNVLTLMRVKLGG
jgi:hypothetical protein